MAIADRMPAPNPEIDPDIERIFAELTAHWPADTALLSDPVKMSMDLSYQQIIGLGPAAVPLIIRNLKAEPDHWFWALTAITRQDPITRAHRGDINQMATDWIEWADQHGYA